MKDGGWKKLTGEELAMEVWLWIFLQQLLVAESP